MKKLEQSLQAARERLESKDYDAARSILTALGEAGDPDAVYELAKMQSDVAIPGYDIDAAIRGYETLADTNDPRALLELGRILAFDVGTEDRKDEAIELLLRAAKEGMIEAFDVLGRLYDDGDSDNPQHHMALRFYLDGLSLGSREALADLRNSLRRAHPSPSEVEAVRLERVFLMKTALEIEYEYDREDKGIRLYHLYLAAAELGHVDAMVNFAMLHLDGRFFPVDSPEAIKWLRQAANAGSPVAWNNLGWIYQQGLGVDVNLDTTITCYEKAAALDYEESIRELIGIYTKADSQYTNPQRACELRKHLVRLGYDQESVPSAEENN